MRGNFIGTDTSNTQTLGNNIGVAARGTNNTIGGTIAAARNIISGNGGAGVKILYTLPQPAPIPPPDPATGNRIFSNSIYDNGDDNPANGEELGIDLVHSNNGDEGVTPNDYDSPPDSDGGIPPNPASAPNRLQNFPVITSAKPITKRIKGKRRRFTVIAGTLNSTPGETFTIQLFSNPVPDPSGYRKARP